MSWEMSPHWKIFEWRLPLLSVAFIAFFTPLALLAARGDRIEIKPKNQSASASTISVGPDETRTEPTTFKQVQENAERIGQNVQESLDAIRESVGLGDRQNTQSGSAEQPNKSPRRGGPVEIKPKYCTIHPSQRLDANGSCQLCDAPPRPKYCTIHPSQRLDAKGRCPLCDAIPPPPPPQPDTTPFLVFGAIVVIIVFLISRLRRKPEDPKWIPDQTWSSPEGSPDILYSQPLAAEDGGNGGISHVCRARLRVEGKLENAHYILKFPRGDADVVTRESVMFEATVLGFLERCAFGYAPHCRGLGRELVRGKGIPWYVMACASGESLDKLMASWKGRPFDAANAGRMLKSLCAALIALHKYGVCHRDIKPRNIFWDGRRVTLIDFGSARIPGAINPAEGNLPSTYRWSAPEQEGGTGSTVGQMADVYSFGIIFCSVVLSLEHLERDRPLADAYGEAVSAAIGVEAAGIVFGKVLAADPEARNGALFALDNAIRNIW